MSNNSLPDNAHIEDNPAKPRRVKRRPFRTQKAFQKKHFHADTMIDNYLHRRRKNTQTLTNAQQKELHRDVARYWLANNASSRVNFEELVERRFEEIESQLAEGTELAMVTLTQRQFAVPIDAAETFDVGALVTWTRKTLQGFDYIGIVEAALYGNYREGRGKKARRVVHFHTHCWVWGFKRPKLAALKRLINMEEAPLFPGGKVMHVRHYPRERWREAIRYMLKGQLSVYQLSQNHAFETLERSGEVVKTPIPSFTQYTYPMRAGDMVRMVRVMASRTLDKLILAGGKEGNALCTAIRREALLKVPRKHLEEEDELFLDRTQPENADQDKC